MSSRVPLLGLAAVLAVVGVALIVASIVTFYKAYTTSSDTTSSDTIFNLGALRLAAGTLACSLASLILTFVPLF
jgi:hypothetical protein